MKPKTSAMLTDVLLELAKVNAKLDIIMKAVYVTATPENTEGYVLKEGSLSDSGTVQVWGNKNV